MQWSVSSCEYGCSLVLMLGKSTHVDIRCRTGRDTGLCSSRVRGVASGSNQLLYVPTLARLTCRIYLLKDLAQVFLLARIHVTNCMCYSRRSGLESELLAGLFANFFHSVQYHPAVPGVLARTVAAWPLPGQCFARQRTKDQRAAHAAILQVTLTYRRVSRTWMSNRTTGPSVHAEFHLLVILTRNCASRTPRPITIRDSPKAWCC